MSVADFNIDLLKTETNHQTTYFIHNTFANAFFPTISQQYHNQHSLIFNNISGILYNDISYHFRIFSFYELKVKRENKSNFYKHITSSANINTLKTQLHTSNWEEVYKDPNPCTSCDTFLEILKTQMNECLLWKTIKVKTCKSEWLTKGILI